MRDARSAVAAPCLPFGLPPEPVESRLRRVEEERDRLLDEVFHLQRIAQTGLMTSGLAHDLANQLTAVMGGAELALMRSHPDALREGLRAVLGHGCRMHETVDAFLSFVRRRENRVRVFAVAEAVDAVVKMMEPLARGESVACLSTCSTTAEIRADRQLVEQALVNLAANAIRAARSGGGRVVLSANDGEPGRVRLSVRDTGPGIPEELRRRLFEPFATSRRETGGTGLGLWIVRQVVERCGGKISIESSPAGTRVDLDLPTV